MAFSKIILNNDTLVDLTDATASPSEIRRDYTAYVSDGTRATGTATVVSDVQINGTSITQNGVANVPIASANAFGAVKVSTTDNVNGIKLGNDGLTTVPADSTGIKAGTSTNKPICPYRQHESIFYGLAKAASDTTQSQSSNAVGVYTDEAKVAIQKMLGIYEAPWELIRNDTGTNATEADIEITVDGNGNAYELTDIRILFWLPTQETAAGKGDYGRIFFHYDNSNKDTVYCGNFTQTNRIIGAEIEQKCNMIRITMWKNTVITAETYQQSTLRDYPYTPNNSQIWSLLSGQRVYNKIVITKVTGTYGYVIYGKRKWN